MHKNGSSSANYSTQIVNAGWKINKHGGSNKGMADGFFLSNKYVWRHFYSIPQSTLLRVFPTHYINAFFEFLKNCKFFIQGMKKVNIFYQFYFENI